MKKYITPDFELDLMPNKDVLFISDGKDDNSLIQDEFDVKIN